jgi:eukaryotic-like serine/threonine-protein kinase
VSGASAGGASYGNYELTGDLGSGGMGEVYRARDSRLNRDVALKILREDARLNPERRARFEREARAAAALSHPNIVGIYDVGAQGETLYIVSELVTGDTLRRLLRGGPLPTRKLLDIAVQVADGLAAAHAAGITHRDLKPENIMVTPDGRAKILDFGVARIAAEAEPGCDATRTVGTEPGRILGTISYMSPEQARASVVDFRSDHFSFGVILHELAGGKHAFERHSSVDTLTAILRDEPAPLTANIPAPLRWIIDRCLNKDPADRYDSTRDLLRDLQNVRDHLSEAYASAMAGVGLVPESVPAPRVKRSRIAVLLAAFLLVIAAMEAVALWRLSQTSDLTRHSIRPLAVGRNASGAIWSPDGKAIAYSGREGNQISQAWIRYLDSPVPVRLTNVPDGAQPLGWSSDSARVYCTAGTGSSLRLISVGVAGGNPEEIRRLPPFFAAAMTPVGDGIAIMDQRDGVYSVSVASPINSEFRKYPQVPFEDRVAFNTRNMSWSPDGSKILVSLTRSFFRTELWIMPWPAAGPRQVLQQATVLRGTPTFDWMPDSRHVVIDRQIVEGGTGHLWIADTQSAGIRQITTGTMRDYLPAVSPDGTRIAYTEESADTSPVGISLQDGTVRDLPAHNGTDLTPAWAGRRNVLSWITVRNGAPEVWVRTVDGTERLVARGEDFAGEQTAYFLTPIPSPDGDRIALARIPDAGVPKYWLVSLAGGKPVRLTNSGPEVSELGGVWSPDGLSFAFLSGPQLAVVKTGGQAAPVNVVDQIVRIPDWSPDGHWLTAGDRNGWYLISPNAQQRLPLGKLGGAASLGFSKDSRRVYGIKTDTPNPVFFYVDLSNPKFVRDVRELDSVHAPGSPIRPGIRFSVAPDGKTAVYSTYRRRTSIQMLENFDTPSLFERLGLTGH